MILRASLRVRNAAAADYKVIRDVHSLAFSANGEGQLVDALRETIDGLISLVAEQDERIIGHALFSRIGAPMRALALGPVGVRPEYQRLGIGSALIRQGLRQAQQIGWDAVFVLGEPTFYRRFGFNAEAAKGYRCAYAGEHFMMRSFSLLLPKSGRLVYPEAWASLEQVEVA